MAIARSLQLDDKTAQTFPSAVLMVEESKTTCVNDLAIVGKVLLSDVA
ncbi:MAG: hypothetical protein QNJ72_13650 [Pleurocapsa sp. MO_226.B13]|nr:hypothetical protein [Pleurocapsa sp. MO_226.B13]